MTTAFEIVLFALLGLAGGSFFNLCIDRLPLGKSIIRPPSYCDSCQHRLKASDLVPVFSYLWLHGSCRYCSAHIPLRLPAVELATALLFALLSWHYGPSSQLAMALVYASLFLVIFVIDLEHGLILDSIVYPGMVLALVFSFFWPELGVGSALIGGVIGVGLMFLPYLISRGGMGLGDVKLAGFIGLATGFPHVFIALFLGILSGGLVASFLLLFRLRTRKEAIPFGPFLAAGAMATVVWGETISNFFVP